MTNCITNLPLVNIVVLDSYSEIYIINYNQTQMLFLNGKNIKEPYF